MSNKQSAVKSSHIALAPKKSPEAPVSPAKLRELYRSILFPRMIEEKMLVLLRSGKVSKWFSGIGQEAISVGCTAALKPDEFLLPLHRNLAVFTGREMPLWKLVAQWQGKATGFSNGRERSFHFGSLEHHVVGMISHLGPQLCIADGIALACKLKKEKKVTLVFTGEGGTSEGDFHEALNIAAVWQLPVIFVIENNGYALSTPPTEQYRCKNLVDRAAGYGMRGVSLDGNDLLAVYGIISQLAEELRANPEPVLVECHTFRMRGHEEASGTKYVPQELFEEWGKRDPLMLFEQKLLNEKVIDQSFIDKTRAELKAHIEESVEEAFAQPEPVPNKEAEMGDVYAPSSIAVVQPGNATTKKRFIDALSDGLSEALVKHENLIVMGQDVAGYGGVFKITEGFLERFGPDRIRNTPLCESGVVGAALGLSLKGFKSVVEMQFADFVSCGFNQIVNNLAKIHYRWGANADVVIRMPTGAGSGAGPFHSQSNEAWFAHVPGLKVVYPSNPTDAKGLLLASIAEPNPVMYFEHKLMYRSLQEEVPDGYYTTEIGKAAVHGDGQDLAIITYGMGVHWAKKILAQHPEIQATIVDLRTLLPLDVEAIGSAVKNCGKVLVLHEDTITCGIGAEVAARIAQEFFEYLDAPVMRCGSLDTPVPFAPVLEKDFFQLEAFEQKLQQLMAY